jgi:hypothetical protein
MKAPVAAHMLAVESTANASTLDWDHAYRDHCYHLVQTMHVLLTRSTSIASISWAAIAQLFRLSL